MLAAAAAVVVIVVVLVGQAGSWVNRSALTRATSHHPGKQSKCRWYGGGVLFFWFCFFCFFLFFFVCFFVFVFFGRGGGTEMRRGEVGEEAGVNCPGSSQKPLTKTKQRA